MNQTLYCQNGGHYYDRIPVRGRQALSCVDHGGTGIPVKKYRAGSKAGQAAFAVTGGAIKQRRTDEAIRRAVAKAIAPRKVPVRVAAGSNEGGPTLQTLTCQYDGHTWQREAKRGTKPLLCPEHRAPVPEQPSTEDDAVDFDLSLFDTFPLDGIEVKPGYRAETSVKEQARILRAAFGEPVSKPEQPKRRTRVTAAALQAPTIVEPETDAHAGEFWCEVGQHWSPRKSNRGRPTVCDEHKASDEYQRQQAVATRDNAEARGAATADRLEALLRNNGTHLSQNADRFQLEERVGKRTWKPVKLTADNYGVKHWAKDDTNAHLLKLRRVRWVPVSVHSG